MRCFGIFNIVYFVNVIFIEDVFVRKLKLINLLMNYDLYDVLMFVLIFFFEILG